MDTKADKLLKTRATKNICLSINYALSEVFCDIFI